MFRSRLLRLGLVGLLGVASYSMSGWVAARPNAAVPDEGAPFRVLPIRVIPVDQAGVMAPVEHGPGTRASATMHQARIQMQDGAVHVKANASVFDRRPEMEFMWTIRVIDPAAEDEVVFERRYEEQIFSVADSGNRSVPVDFEDVIRPDVPLGSYLVQLVIYQVFPDGGVLALDDPKTAKSRIVAKGQDELVLGE